MNRIWCVLFFMATGPVAALNCGAQMAGNYPERPIRMIVPFPPGGSVDGIGRLLAPRLAEKLGQQMVIDNRPGGNGVLGTELLARSAPDGYSIILLGASTHVINSLLKRNLPYDSFRDFAPVATIQRSNYVLVVHPSLPVRNVKQLVALAKTQPGEINYASSGNGNMNHLAAELFNMMTGVKTHHIPYKGGGQALTDLISGQVQMHFAVPISAISFIQSGRLRALAIGGDARFPTLPDVPTFAQSGLSGFSLRPWQGVLAPARTPRAIVDRLSAEIAAVVALPAFRQRLLSLGMEPLVSTPEQFATLMAEDRKKSAAVIQAARIELN